MTTKLPPLAGMRVISPDWGPGTIIDVYNSATSVEVEFDHGKDRRFYPLWSIARLEIAP